MDPDLDSYYTMSLIVLRYPELLELVHGIGAQLQKHSRGTGGRFSDTRTQYLILEGRLDATAKGIESDFAEAVAAGGVPVKAALTPDQQKLAAGIEAFRQAARTFIDLGPSSAAMAGLDSTQRALVQQLRQTWTSAGVELDRLLDVRIDGLFSRMWLHLGTALFLLMAILTMVYCVARQIVVPLRRLSDVTDTVRRTGDHTLRANWQSEDEIGRLVLGFNDMLAQLDREREVQKELAANARAAEAQQTLVEASPIPMVVTAVPGHEVLHANQPAQHWLAGRKSDPWAVGLEPGVRSRFFQHLADRDAVDAVRGALESGQRARLGSALGKAAAVPGTGRGAHHLHAHQPPEADGATARIVGQGVRGLVRGHHDSARRRAHPERQPRFRARHRLRVPGRSRAAARVPSARPGRRAVLPQPVDHGAAARRLAGRGDTAGAATANSFRRG